MDGESEAVVAMFVKVLDVRRDVAIALMNAGHTTIEEIAYIPLDELTATQGLEDAQAISARERARAYLTPDAR